MKNKIIIFLLVCVVILSYYSYFARTCYFAQGAMDTEKTFIVKQPNSKWFYFSSITSSLDPLPGDVFACSMIGESVSR